MKHIFPISLAILFLITSASLRAQTDTGGGMGGTGVKEKPSMIDPVKADSSSDKECRKETSIGLYQLKTGKDKKIKEQGYICSGQTIKTKSAETIDIHFRSGERIKILENSQIYIDKNGD
jgi:hypothetical protein